MKQRRLSDQEKIDVIEKFKTGKYSYTSLANEYKISIQGIRYLIKSRKAEAPKDSYFYKSKRQYSLNEKFFDIIDTEQKAYFLGLLYADGCNYEKRGAVVISLQDKDIEILEKLKLLIDSNRPIKRIAYSQKKSKLKDQQRLSLNSKVLSYRLAELGCISRKSLILKFPTKEQVPPHLVRHFVRGYFDGDGSISDWNEKSGRYRVDASLVSTLDFCNELKILIKSSLNIDATIKNKKDSQTTTRTLKIRENQIKTFMLWLYSNCNIFLKRKHDRYISIFEGMVC